jgi:hypothetical protein
MVFKRPGVKRVERQLRATVVDLSAARERLMVAKEQYEAFREDDEDARMRSLGSEMVDDRHVADQARRHADVMRSDVERAEGQVASLERVRDELLAKYEPSG